MRWLIFCALLAGCHSPPPPPVVTDLHFPVVIFFGDASAVLFQDATALGTMQIGNLNTVTGPPPLIDSQFTVYSLAQLASTHNGLWLMAHPTGSAPVTFKLERAPQSGLEAARTLFRSRLDAQTWRPDLDERRRDLTIQQTLPGMLSLVQSDGGRRPESR